MYMCVFSEEVVFFFVRFRFYGLPSEGKRRKEGKVGERSVREIRFKWAIVGKMEEGTFGWTPRVRWCIPFYASDSYFRLYPGFQRFSWNTFFRMRGRIFYDARGLDAPRKCFESDWPTFLATSSCWLRESREQIAAEKGCHIARHSTENLFPDIPRRDYSMKFDNDEETVNPERLNRLTRI